MKAMPLPSHMKSTQQAVNKHWPQQHIVLVTNSNPSTYIKIIRLICDMCSLIYDETLLVLKAEYSRITWLMPWLLMPWLPVSPGHLQPLYWICRINGTLASVRKVFNYLCHSLLRNDWKCKYILCCLAHCGLVMLHGGIKLGQHWLR